jgi:hypothetical protein
MQKERYEREINQNHTEVCRTFLKLGAKLSETTAKF